MIAALRRRKAAIYHASAGLVVILALVLTLRTLCELNQARMPDPWAYAFAIENFVRIDGPLQMRGWTGVLIPEGDFEGASVQLARMITDEGWRQRLGRAARIRAEHSLDWSLVF